KINNLCPAANMRRDINLVPRRENASTTDRDRLGEWRCIIHGTDGTAPINGNTGRGISAAPACLTRCNGRRCKGKCRGETCPSGSGHCLAFSRQCGESGCGEGGAHTEKAASAQSRITGPVCVPDIRGATGATAAMRFWLVMTHHVSPLAFSAL